MGEFVLSFPLPLPPPMPKLPAAKSPSTLSDAEALELVMELMTIAGRSGEEAVVAEYVTGQLRAAGAKPTSIRFDSAHRRTPLGGQVGNLVLKLPGRRRGPRRLLSAHMDTVPVCVGSRPLRSGGRVVSADRDTGLGADNRAGCAVLLGTALELLRGDGAHPPLTFLWTVQEEAGLFGARHVRKTLLGKPRLAFNFDGGSPAKLTIGATGGYRMTIDVHGIASHAGGAPADGVSAIAIASLAIADLVEGGWHGQIEQGRHTGTSNVGVVCGGTATNVVADHVSIQVEARCHEPKFRRRIVQEIEKAFQRAAKAVRNTAGRRGRVVFAGRLDYEAFHLERNAPCVVAAAAAIEAEGRQPELAISNGGLDANWLTAHGIPTVTLGCGQRNIHSVDEQLDVADFHLARRLARRLATATDSL